MSEIEKFMEEQRHRELREQDHQLRTMVAVLMAKFGVSEVMVTDEELRRAPAERVVVERNDMLMMHRISIVPSADDGGEPADPADPVIGIALTSGEAGDEVRVRLT